MSAPVQISRTFFPMGDDMLEVRHTKALVTLLGRELLDAIKARSTQLSEPQEHGAPLPPTAEQAIIARFNALANEIRELTEAVCRARKSSDTVWELDSKFIESVKDCLAVLNADLDGIKERGREHSMAIAALCDSQTDLHKKIDRLALDEKIGYDAVMRMLAKPNVAVDENAKASLVGKKGTGRKG